MAIIKVSHLSSHSTGLLLYYILVFLINRREEKREEREKMRKNNLKETTVALGEAPQRESSLYQESLCARALVEFSIPVGS